ncbi:hypothetical protein KUTeg_008064 [Tegillarca granosa]|uniref:Uncharacterized protein n=1 Tax=Tegillarca granosa TaxID=220873 RepID=A0ABQ9F825_TEGGR|nr:hypothetical protein KUTeg_008064 [Tegillarca granosa]
MQGSLILAGAIHSLIGVTGIVGFLMRTAIMAIILSMYLCKRKVPIPIWTRKNGFQIIWYPLHQVLSLLLSVIFGWILSAILTHFNLISSDPKSPESFARTDSRSDAITSAHRFYLPYPGQFGLPSFNIGMFCAFLIGSIMSVIDSICDYHACAATCKVPAPPGLAINRGIAIEGFCSAISGTVGCGHATSTFGNNIGAIAVTKVSFYFRYGV